MNHQNSECFIYTYVPVKAEIFSLYFQLILFLSIRRCHSSSFLLILAITSLLRQIPFSNALMLFHLKASGKPLLYDKIGVYRGIQFFLFFFFIQNID